MLTTTLTRIRKHGPCINIAKGFAYYNEIDPFAAAWLRELIKRGLIADGDVDERSIADVRPDDVAGYAQVHFFAGLGGWSHALRLAGWPDDRPVWTGSCPCQPFSVAGRGRGVADERHLWPEMQRLVAQCRPPIVFGEQVASAAGRSWLDLVFDDLEAMDYACGAADLCAAGVGAPHIRQRLYWVGHTFRRGFSWQGLSDTPRSGFLELAGASEADIGRADTVRGAIDSGGVANADDARSQGRSGAGGTDQCIAGQDGMVDSPSSTDGYWRDADWLASRDGKWRPVEPGTFPLADGVPVRVGRLRGYGNAIVPQVAAAFVALLMAGLI